MKVLISPAANEVVNGLETPDQVLVAISDTFRHMTDGLVAKKYLIAGKLNARFSVTTYKETDLKLCLDHETRICILIRSGELEARYGERQLQALIPYCTELKLS